MLHERDETSTPATARATVLLGNKESDSCQGTILGPWTGLLFKTICIIRILTTTFIPPKILTNASTVLPQFLPKDHKERHCYPSIPLQSPKASKALQESSALPPLSKPTARAKTREKPPATSTADPTAALTLFPRQLINGTKTTVLIAQRLTV